MQIYVNKKKKWTKVPQRLFPIKRTHYSLIWSENGYCCEEKFEDRLDLLKYLLYEDIYKQEKFPLKLISVNEFISSGFSIYF